MCVVSNISDHYGRDWQQPRTVPGPFLPQSFQWPPAAPVTLPWTKEALDMLKELIERTKQLDAKLGLPDCEDPKKAEWMQAIEARLKALEDEKGGE